MPFFVSRDPDTIAGARRLPACRVLIIPHCTDCGSVLQQLLSLSGCPVEIIRDGDAAVRRALEVRPQVVLLDIGVPGADGSGSHDRVGEDCAREGRLCEALGEAARGREGREGA